jgi:hypothetical protein
MVGGNTLDHLSLALQNIFQEHTKPFAGISILAVGDLLQLNPVGDRAVFEPAVKGYTSLKYSTWQEHLTTILRQKGDPIFAELLSRVRIGSMTDADIETLRELETAPEAIDQHANAVRLFLTNKQVTDHNDNVFEGIHAQQKFTIKACGRHYLSAPNFLSDSGVFSSSFSFGSRFAESGHTPFCCYMWSSRIVSRFANR